MKHVLWQNLLFTLFLSGLIEVEMQSSREPPPLKITNTVSLGGYGRAVFFDSLLLGTLIYLLSSLFLPLPDLL